MPERSRAFVLTLLELAVAALAIWQILEVATAMSARVSADWDLEWMEGATLLSALRVAQGLPIHGEPTVEYVPFIYPPGYAWLLAACSSVYPLGYSLGRAVSVVATLVASVALLAGARAAGARWGLALGCVGLFWGTWVDGGTFLDLVRTDSVSLALLASALVVAALPSRAATVIGGLLLAVAFTTKHHVAAFGFPIALGLWSRDGWRRAAMFAAASAGPALGFVAWQQVASEGWFLTWILGVPSSHGLVGRRLLPNLDALGRPQGAQWELWSALPITTTLCVLAARRWALRTYWLGVAITALVVASVMRGHVGGFLNVLIPCLWVQSLLPALLARSAERAPLAHAALLAAVGAQLLFGRDELRSYVPKDGDDTRHAAFVEALRELPEPLWLPHAPWAAVQAGKRPSVALITLWDIDHPTSPARVGVRRIRDAVGEGHFATIVLPAKDLGYGLAAAYARRRPLTAPSVRTVTGWNVEIRHVWTPRAADDPPARRRAAD